MTFEISQRRTAIWATAIIVIGSIVLLFTHLGRYALWDDESLAAMTARSVWRTGDTSALVDDHNLLAYRNGLLIKGFSDRYSPPLQFYFLAPFIGLLGQSTFVCRLPFAICGLLTIAVMLRWMWRVGPPAVVWWAAVVIILTDASFFLFNRQCRYYGLACLFTVLVAYGYYKWSVWKESLLPLVLAMVGLLVSHYLNYAAVVGCLLVDYFLWGRKRRVLAWRDWLVLLAPQIIVAAIVCSIWNPAARSAAVAAAGRANTLGAAEYASTAVPFMSFHWWHNYLSILLWNWRDMFASDFIIIPLLLASPVIYLMRKENWLLRGPTAVFVFILITALMTTHPVDGPGDAEIRYLVPVLPLGIGIAIVAVWAQTFLKRPLMICVLALAAISMLVGPSEGDGKTIYAPTAFCFYREIVWPQREPYTPVAEWINTNVAPGESVYVQPDYMTYPLMFHAGKAMYAWQLSDSPKPEYAHVSDVLIKGRVAPEYLIAFGPYTKLIDAAQSQLLKRGIRYEKVETIHVFWRDEFRPEKIWRSFVTVHATQGNEVYIYKKKG